MKLKVLNEALFWQWLAWCADYLGKASIGAEDAYNVSAAGNPDNRFVFFIFQASACVNLEKLGVQGSLKQAERELVDSYICLR